MQHQDGDDAAFEDLYRRYYGRLFRFCLRRTGNPHDAEELTQEAFARAYRAMPMLRGERRFYPWLSVIASRLCVDSHRRLGRIEPSADVDPGQVEVGPDRLEAAVDHDLLVQALARLSPRHREVLHLREREGWTYQRIAEHYDITMGAVEGLLFRARQALRREFLVVAGPEAGLAAGLPFGLGLAASRLDLGRRFAGLRLRVGEWASGWANLPALAANGVGLAMVVSTAVGLAGAAATGGHARPVSVAAAAGPIASAASIDRPVAVGAVAPVAAAVAPPAAPAARAPQARPSGSAQAAPPVAGVNLFLGDPNAAPRANDQPVANQAGPVVAGLDPDAVVAGISGDASEYVQQSKEYKK
ncbi:MAG: polymerase sigma-70 factor, subfamily [Acidimicrobiaceae bacterium]|nr:polymerase sigma-70 factor, subfamily [Acidimicrobiaceae bacterium]